MVGIELVKDNQTKQAFSWEDCVGVRVCNKVRERGCIVRPLGNVIVLMPPLSISISEIDKLVESVYISVSELCEEKRKI